MQEIIPQKQIKPKHCLPWATQIIHKLIRAKYRLISKLKHNPRPDTKEKYKQAGHTLQKEPCKAYWAYLEDNIDYTSEPNIWAAVFTFNPYLLISINELTISIIHLLISISELLISINKLLISINELLISINELLISTNISSSTLFIDINNLFIDINKGIIDINNSFIDINKYGWRCHIYWYQ